MTTNHPRHDDTFELLAVAPEAELSARGLNRRTAMLRDLRGHVRARRRRRRASAALGAVAACAAAGVVVWLTAASAPSAPAPAENLAAESEIAAPRPEAPARPIDAAEQRPGPVRIEWIASDSSALERLSVGTSNPSVVRLSDRELVAELQAAGTRAGLIRTPQGVTVTLTSRSDREPTGPSSAAPARRRTEHG